MKKTKRRLKPNAIDKGHFQAPVPPSDRGGMKGKGKSHVQAPGIKQSSGYQMKEDPRN
jgi:hypothetical protein